MMRADEARADQSSLYSSHFSATWRGRLDFCFCFLPLSHIRSLISKLLGCLPIILTFCRIFCQILHFAIEQSFIEDRIGKIRVLLNCLLYIFEPFRRAPLGLFLKRQGFRIIHITIMEWVLRVELRVLESLSLVKGTSPVLHRNGMIHPRLDIRG